MDIASVNSGPRALLIAAVNMIALIGLCGGLAAEIDTRSHGPSVDATHENAPIALPSSFDWRDHGVFLPVRSQVCSPESWAFAAVAAVESAIIIDYGVRTDLSEQWLISCTDAGAVGYDGSFARAMEFMTFDGAGDPCGDSGAVKEWDCYFHCDPPPCDCPYAHPYLIEDWQYIPSGSNSMPSVDAIKQAILDFGPVAAQVHASHAFIEYEGGVLGQFDLETGPPDHHVLLMGWDDNQGAEGVWILRNSWGTDWGEGGYMRIEYGVGGVGYGACYVAGVIRDCNGNGVPDDQDIAEHYSEDCNDNGIPDECDIIDRQPGFTGVASWTTFDPSAAGVGSNPVGFHGAVFDGRFVYFVPAWNGGTGGAELLRFDTSGEFDDTSSWASQEVGVDNAGRERGSYTGGVFDGRYIYFAPDRNRFGPHGTVMRLDTQGNLNDESSWAWFDPGQNGVGDDPRGYHGAAFDGRFVYFAPDKNGGGPHGEVLRLDTTGSFSDINSWSTFDPGDHGVGADPDGFNGTVFDGRFVYFVPHFNGNPYAFEVMRYDTAFPFDDPEAWSTFDPQLEGMGGSVGGTFDGRHVYLAPISGFGDRVGLALRFDITADFTDPSSWDSFRPAEHGVGHNPDAEYRSALFDGRFIYYVPYFGDSGPMGEVLRFDTTGQYADPHAWSAFDAGSNAVGNDPDGYHGAAFDGRFVYFAPLANGGPYHGEVLRYDTSPDREPDCNDNGVPDECDIADGFSEDVNGNGIPDECEQPATSQLATPHR